MAITKTVNTKISVDDESNLVTYEGVSTDSKPTELVATNSRFHELDTGKYYFFSAGSWAEMPTSGGGGSTNTTETYTGTLDGLGTQLVTIAGNHYGLSDDMTLQLANGFSNGDVSAIATIDATAIGMESYVAPMGAVASANNHTFFIQGVDTSPTLSDWLSYGISEIFGTGSGESMYMQSGTTITDMSPYASYITYSLTLYWHEMPTPEPEPVS